MSEWDELSREQKLERLLRGWYEALDIQTAEENTDGLTKGRNVIWGTPFGKGNGQPPHRYGLHICGNSYDEAIFGQLRDLQESTAELLGIRPPVPYTPDVIPVVRAK